ncbi:glycine-rich domain-containing protein, partial [Chryseobacterium pennipullorum]
METKMVLQDESLWNRIHGFSLDAPDADFPFSKKLAKEENWSLDFCQKAIEEYKKFVYLCCILPNGASPSKIVDKVWHMHLIYTQNYWEEFCPHVLKRALHHHPSKGGPTEKDKHQNWFEDTLQNYRKVFQQEAPKEIWKELRKKSDWKSWLKKTVFFSPVLLVLLLYSCTDGTGFTGLLVTAVVFAIIFILSVISSIVGDHDVSNPDKKDKQNNDGGGSGCGGGGSGCSG